MNGDELFEADSIHNALDDLDHCVDKKSIVFYGVFFLITRIADAAEVPQTHKLFVEDSIDGPPNEVVPDHFVLFQAVFKLDQEI